MFCKYCGEEIPDNAQYCKYCGEKVPEGARRAVRSGVPAPDPLTNLKEKLAKAGNQGDLKKIGIGIAAAVIVVFAGILILKNRDEGIAGKGILPFLNKNKTETVENYSKIADPKPLPPQELSKKLAWYKNEKSKYDQQIADFASRVNQHLQRTDNFRQTTFAQDGRNLNQQIMSCKMQLQQDTSIPADNRDKKLLLQLFDLESQRIMGMVEGIEAALQGGDYQPGFSKGTSASYRFDDVNAQLGS